MIIYISLFPDLQAQEKLEVEGAISIGKLAGSNPSPGSIQWNGNDFLGWDGFKWKSLTQMVTYNGTVTDEDGNIYNTVIIGDQEWMAENLRTTKYDDGTDINYITVNAEWQFDLSGAFSWYNHNASNKHPYGGVYNWFAVNSFHGLCPAGWEVPTISDWDELFDYLGGNIFNDVGTKLKEKRTAHWTSPNNGATNETGFTAVPGGHRSFAGNFGGQNDYGRYWSRTQSGSNALGKYMWHAALELYGETISKNYGYSVRCMRDVN